MAGTLRKLATVVRRRFTRHPNYESSKQRLFNLKSKKDNFKKYFKMHETSGMDLKVEKQSAISMKAAVDPTPEKAVSHYFKTKYEKNLLVKKKPNWDEPRVSPASELVAAKRELFAAENHLEWCREDQRIKTKRLDEEWEYLRLKEISLREAIIKFNKFVKENHEKRERAEIKINEEREFQNSRQQEINELQDKVDYMKSIKDEMEKHVKEYKMYENFLQQVISISNEMNSSYDILNRYETLASARIELAARQEKNLTALETARKEMIKLTEEKSQIMMGLNTELAQLQIRYDRAKAMTLRWETALARIKNISAEKALELDQVKISCWNLYTAMCTRKGVEMTVDPENIEEQLVFIKRSIQELKRILRIVQRKAAKEVTSTKQRHQSVASSLKTR